MQDGMEHPYRDPGASAAGSSEQPAFVTRSAQVDERERAGGCTHFIIRGWPRRFVNGLLKSTIVDWPREGPVGWLFITVLELFSRATVPSEEIDVGPAGVAWSIGRRPFRKVRIVALPEVLQVHTVYPLDGSTAVEIRVRKGGWIVGSSLSSEEECRHLVARLSAAIERAESARHE
jgi:hypothetical protein